MRFTHLSWQDKDVHSLVFVNYLAMAAVVTAPVMGLGPFKETWAVPSSWALVLLVALATLASVGETMMAFGLKVETAAKATSMNYLQVVFAFIFQRTLLHESSSDFQSKMGALLISLWGIVALAKEAAAQASAPNGPGRGLEPLLDDGKDKTKPMTLSPGLLAMIVGAFFFSLMALLVKLLSGFGTYELVFWRSVFMFVGTMSMLAVKRINPLGPPGSRVLLWVRAAAGFGFMSGYYYAIQHLALSDAVVITYTSPVITAIAAALLLGEALRFQLNFLIRASLSSTYLIDLDSPCPSLSSSDALVPWSPILPQPIIRELCLQTGGGAAPHAS